MQYFYRLVSLLFFLIIFKGVDAQYYWVGGPGNWSDTLHWSNISGGAPNYGTIPSLNDSVYFDANSGLNNGDTVFVDTTAVIYLMDWSAVTTFPVLKLIKNLSVSKTTVLNPNLKVFSTPFVGGIFKIETDTNAVFDPLQADFEATFVFNAQDVSDTLLLLSRFYQSNNASYILEGTFISLTDTVKSLAIIMNTDSLKNIDLNTGYFELVSGWSAQGVVPSAITLDADSAIIDITGSYAVDFFHGNGYAYHIVKMGSFADTNIITSSNTFDKLIFKNGLRVSLEAGRTQTVSDSLIIVGQCPDSIFVFSTVAGTRSNFNANNVVSEVVNFQDIRFNSSITTYFSKNLGNNQNITFDNTPSATANFTLPYQLCINQPINFNNSSTVYSSNFSDLSFIWTFGAVDTINPDTVYVPTPTYTYTQTGQFYVTLTATYNYNNCSNTLLDSVNINDPSTNIYTSDADTSICQGDNIGFSGTYGLGNYDFYINNTLAQSDTLFTFNTTALNNNDSVWLITNLNGCKDTSTAIPVQVLPLPILNETLSSGSDTICSADTLTINVSGADVYQFYYNNSTIGGFSSISTKSYTNIITGDTIYIVGKDTVSQCQDTSGIHIFTVNQNPIVVLNNLTGGNVICAGDSFNVQASGATNYQFFINQNPVTSYTPDSLFSSTTLNSGDVISVSGESNNCFANGSPDITVIVNPLPVINVTSSDSDLTICANENISFTATGASTYTFYVNGISVQGPSGSNNYSSSNFNNNDILTVAGTLNGCSDTSSADTINIIPLPVVNFTSSDADTSICLNDTVTFTASGATSYQYLINGIPVGTLSANNLYITDSLQNNQTVSLIGSQNGCQNTSVNQYTFTVNPIPQVSFYSSDSVICYGENITFTATGGDSYEFFVNNVSQNAPSPTNVFSTSTLPAGWQNISVMGYLNGCGNYADTSYIINVKSLPAISLFASADTICEGDSISFWANNAQNYQFYINGIAQGPYTNDSTFSPSSLQNSDTISVVGIENGCSNTGDTSYTIIVKPMPVISFSSSDIDNVICANDTITLTANGATTFNFYIDSNFVFTNSTGIYVTDSIQNGQTISVEGNLNGCISKANNAFTFTVNPLPVTTLTVNDSDLTICENDILTFSANGTNFYQFYLNGISINGNFSTTNTYTSDSINNNDTITVWGMSNYGCRAPSNDTLVLAVLPNPTLSFNTSDADGLLCIDDTVSFMATGATNYLFMAGNDTLLGFSSVNTLTIDSLANNTTISVIGEQNGCYASADTAFNFSVYTYPQTYLTTNDSIDALCIGDSATFIAGGALTYEFFINGTGQGVGSNNVLSGIFNNNDTISVVGYNNICPAQADTSLVIAVFNYPSITLSINPTTTNICYDDTVNISATGANEYAFYVNQFNIQPTSLNNSLNIWNLENSDTIKVIGYNGKCASPVQTVNFSVTKLNLQLTANPAHSICQGEQATLTASGASQYQFFENNTSVTALSANNVYTASPVNNSYYFVKGTASGCTQTSYFVYIDVYENPQISPAGPIKICDGDSVLLHSSAYYGNQWYNSAGIISNETDSTYWATTTENYYVNFEAGGNGVVLSLGNNSNGQFGDSSIIGSVYPVKALKITNATDIKTGENHSVALKSDGTVWTWGDNSFGQIGLGNFTDQTVPYQIPSLSSIQIIGCGSNHSFAYNGSTIYAWGDNTYGELGLGSNGIANFPTPVTFSQPITMIDGGENYSLLLDVSGNVWSTGRNNFGQLGIGNNINQSVFTQISALNNIIQISAGVTHALALDNNGNVWVWGNNANGQLGLSNVLFTSTPVKLSGLPKITHISAGADHSVLIDEKGHLLTFGNNQYGQLGTGNFNNSTTPQHITEHQFSSVYVGYYNTFALKSDSSVWAFGKNQYGQIKANTTLPITTPYRMKYFNGSRAVSSGLYYSTAINTNTHSCQSNIVQVSIDTTPDIQILTNNDTLYTTVQEISYQWYLNNNPIPGATSNSFVPTTSGLYTVEVSFTNGCSATSSEYYLPPAGIDLQSVQNSFSIYPNPSFGQVYITPNKVEKDVRLLLFDVSGKVVFSKTILLFDKHEKLDLKQISSGMYFLQIITENKIEKFKIILNQ